MLLKIFENVQILNMKWFSYIVYLGLVTGYFVFSQPQDPRPSVVITCNKVLQRCRNCYPHVFPETCTNVLPYATTETGCVSYVYLVPGVQMVAFDKANSSTESGTCRFFQCPLTTFVRSSHNSTAYRYSDCVNVCSNVTMITYNDREITATASQTYTSMTFEDCLTTCVDITFNGTECSVVFSNGQCDIYTSCPDGQCEHSYKLGSKIDTFTCDPNVSNMATNIPTTLTAATPTMELSTSVVTTTTEPSTTTELPTSTEPSTTLEPPTTTMEITTTVPRTTTEPSTSTEQPTTTVETTTTEPSTTTLETTTTKPSTTTEPQASAVETTTTEPSRTTEPPASAVETTTTVPSTTTEPPATVVTATPAITISTTEQPTTPSQATSIPTKSKLEPIFILPCMCHANKIFQNKTQEQIREYILQDLKIDVKNTAKARNKLKCIDDTRLSSISIGTLGILILSTVICFFVFNDCTSFYHHNHGSKFKHTKSNKSYLEKRWSAQLEANTL